MDPFLTPHSIVSHHCNCAQLLKFSKARDHFTVTRTDNKCRLDPVEGDRSRTTHFIRARLLYSTVHQGAASASGANNSMVLPAEFPEANRQAAAALLDRWAVDWNAIRNASTRSSLV